MLLNVNPTLESIADKENAFQQAVLMLIREEFTKKVIDRGAHIHAIKVPKARRKVSRSFFGYHLQSQSDSHGEVTEVATRVFSPTRRPQVEQDQSPKDIRTIN